MEHDEVAIDFVEPRLNFRSLEHIPQGQSTHFGHVAKLERFMKDVVSWLSQGERMQLFWKSIWMAPQKLPMLRETSLKSSKVLKMIVNFWGRTFRVFSVLYCGVPHAGFRRPRTSCWEKTRWPCKEAWRDLIWASNSRDFDTCYAVAQPPGPWLIADPCGSEILKSLRNTSDE